MDRFENSLAAMVTSTNAGEETSKKRRMEGPETVRAKVTLLIGETTIFKELIADRAHRAKIFTHFKSEENCQDFLCQFNDEDRLDMLKGLV
jgi:hypothetical protein